MPTFSVDVEAVGLLAYKENQASGCKMPEGLSIHCPVCLFELLLLKMSKQTDSERLLLS